jgi:hypothetical protein
MISLIPVIEFEPASYSKRTRESPSVTSRDDPQAWELYWRESLEDSGIDELHPHRAGGWYVPVTELTRPSTLRALLDVAFDKVNATLENDLPMDELPMLPGGYVLGDGRGEIEPGCCSDFSNIDSWREAVAWRSREWKMVWVGHPWTYVSAEGDTLRFLQPSEDDRPKATDIHLSVPRGDLVAAIPVAVTLVETLAERLRSIVAECHPASVSAEIVGVLTWGHFTRGRAG